MFRPRQVIKILLDTIFNYGMRFLPKTIEERFVRGDEYSAIFHKFLLINKPNNLKVVFPYEAQPEQNRLILDLRKSRNTKIFGYIHSSIHNFPPFMIRRSGYPHYLLSHGSATARVLETLCGWDANQVIACPSFRYIKRQSAEFEGKIFLPYSIPRSEFFIEIIESFLVSDKYGQFEIRLHPAMKSDPEHNKLKNRLESLIDSYCSKSEEKTAIFVGATFACIEALENGVEEVVHICLDKFVGLYSSEIWPELQVTKISDFVAKYKLNDKNAFIDYKNSQTESIVDFVSKLELE